MKTDVCHAIGNGDSFRLYNPKSKGVKMTCNLPPFTITDAYATGIVDFKMMRAIQEGSVIVPGDWVLGFRPKVHMDRHPFMRMQFANQIKEFYTTLPNYVPDYQKFSCGHMITHYMCTKFSPEEMHLYGFDSIFDFSTGSMCDLFLESNRDPNTIARMTQNWRNIWPAQFAEFPKTKFILHSKHKDTKLVTLPENVEIFVHKK